MEAAANGASNAVVLVGNIIANLIAFIAFIGFLNFIIQWFASLVGYDYVTFEVLFYICIGSKNNKRTHTHVILPVA